MTEDVDYIQLEEEQIESLSGLHHLCPLCFSQLSLRSMPNPNERHWHCSNCGTEWPIGALIDALNYDELELELKHHFYLIPGWLQEFEKETGGK